MSDLKPCGTYAAAKRHEAHGEPVCEPCHEARLEYNREWYQKTYRGTATRPRRHATNSMYVNGCRCDDCTWAHSVYQAEWRAGKKPWRQRSRKVADAIRDVLSTFYPEKLPTDILVLRVLGLHPDWDGQSIRRILQRCDFESAMVDGRKVWWCESWD